MSLNPLTLKRVVLTILTVIVGVHVSLLLLRSLNEPQITSQLELYQTDLVLHAAELRDETGAIFGNPEVGKAIVGDDPLQTALEQYQSVRQSAEKNLAQFQRQLAQREATPPNSALSPSDSSSAPPPASGVAESSLGLQTTIQQQQASIQQLDLRIGMLQAKQQDTAAALQTWTGLKTQVQPPFDANPIVATADTLSGLWSTPPRLLPDAELLIQKNLEGWFRYTALSRLYELQQRADALAPLQAAEQEVAHNTFVKLVAVGTVPVLGVLVGVGLLIVLIGQWLLRGKQALIEQNADLVWETPWTWEITLQVLMIGFFFLGQLVVPFLLGLGQAGISLLLSELGKSTVMDNRAKAIYSMTYYLTMAGATLLVLYLSIKPFLPLSEGWFRVKVQGNWFLWGIGSYFVALPLMILISLVNQQIWQGQGGSNPLLQIVLEEADPIALTIFFLTAAIAAPVFEETLFRGFLLPSLTRYVPVWGAIAISSLIFATAHLSLSEILPLTVLGTILGFVYTRSRSLLSSMLLHSLWNSATMIGLFLLGSGAK